MKLVRSELLDTPRILELKRKKQKHQRVKRIFFGTLFLIFFSGLVAFSYAPMFRITKIVIEGNVVTEKEDILSQAQSVLSGKYAFIFSKKHAWIAPYSQMQKNMMQSFPIFSNVVIENEDIHTVHITVTERTASYLWCGILDTHISLDTPCHFLDDTGYIYTEAPRFSGNAFFRFYGPLLDRDVSYAIGGLVMSREEFVYAKTFLSGLKNLGLKPYSFVRADTDVRRIYLEHPSGDVSLSPYIIFSVEDDVVTLLQNFESAYNAEPLKTEFASNFLRIATIDLRFKNKVYYTYR